MRHAHTPLLCSLILMFHVPHTSNSQTMVQTRKASALHLKDQQDTAPMDCTHSDTPNSQPLSSAGTAPFPLPHNTPTTPRSHKQAGGKRLQGITELAYDVPRMKILVKKRLKLDFDIEDWQVHIIHRLLQGYDGVCVAGTGYGKSIIFEGLAVMSKKKVVLVVCPLKVLEKDQVSI